mmetsp:Transcript_10627/g.41279  ORF Transcript_10627/g.41279 Transcript_10627/m.41279 type:complete len:1065 (-) Transcript_10627:7-3201(-)
MSEEMLSGYHPRAVEHAWDAWWSKKGFYTADPKAAAEAGEDGRFVIVIPPPNVTGSLHLGHGLTCSIQDALCRWHRMHGRPVMWLPGTDHAGIATQTVVERRLAKDEGKTRHDLGREDFLKRVWEWKEQYGGRIVDQLKHLGVSVDWTRERFTMDESLSVAVTEAFCRMHAKGLIYRDTRMVNWCCALNSAISDIEVDTLELDKPTRLSVPGHDPAKKYEFGTIISFAYPVEDSDERVVVATTRLETMLGDVAVAVHPEDPRYTHLHGKHVVHPFNGKKLPIICDDVLVDMAFGTGAVKITPAHDPNDFACGRRNGLPEVVILNDDGTMNSECAQFAGMRRYDAREAVQAALAEKGLYVGTAPNKMSIATCSRTGDLIEPMLKPQWWVNCKDMAERATAAVRNGDLTILPDMHEATWYRWLDDCRDWCISRQLWWGHRIPAYHAEVDGEVSETADRWVVARTEAEAKTIAAERFGVSEDKVTLKQDEDVLDTWFSSGLFPFSTFGWPEKTADLDGFFPNSLLETGHDILFFWVARMVMLGLELTDTLPFRTVYLHAMVRDKYGRKMSKSLGNVIDPLEVINGCPLAKLHAKLEAGNLPPKEVAKAKAGQTKEFPEGIPECGADALRFGLLSYTLQGRDINLSIGNVVAHRHFCNKLWNATRFAMNAFEDYTHDTPTDSILGALAAAAAAQGSTTVADTDAAVEAATAGTAAVAAAAAASSADTDVSAVTAALASASFASRPGYKAPVGSTGPITVDAPAAGGKALVLAPRDRWILSRLNAACRSTELAMRSFAFAEACSAAHHFWLEDLCDVYLELTKPVFRGEDEAAKHAARLVLYTCLDRGLRLLHPMMPFVTEELWQRLPGRGAEAAPGVPDPESIMISTWPLPVKGMDAPELDAQMTRAMGAIRSIRTLRTQASLRPSANADVILTVTDAEARSVLETFAEDISTLGSTDNLRIVDAAGFKAPRGCAMEVADDAIVALVNLSGLVDTEQELARLSKQQEKKQSAVESLNKRMEGAGWDKIPEEVREKDEEAKRKLDDELAAISKAIALMEAMQKAAATEE